MGVENLYAIEAGVFEGILKGGKEGESREERGRRVWFGVADKVTANWNGMKGDVFFGSLSPGQFAVVVLSRMDRSVSGSGDVETFLAYSPTLAARCGRAFEILGAGEYVALWGELAKLFPGGKFPVDAEGWGSVMMRMSKKMAGELVGMKEKLVEGKGMEKGLWEYAYEYVVGKPEEFCRAKEGV